MKTILLILACIVVFSFVIWQGVIIWDECREAGRSVLYCIGMVTR